MIKCPSCGCDTELAVPQCPNCGTGIQAKLDEIAAAEKKAKKKTKRKVKRDTSRTSTGSTFWEDKA